MVSTRLIPFLAALTGLFNVVASASDSAPNIVDLGYAKYRGNLSFPDTVAFLGVPYAEPPLGERRWRRPLPLNTGRIARETQGKIVDLTEYPDFCIQGSIGGMQHLILYDCSAWNVQLFVSQGATLEVLEVRTVSG